MNFGVRTDLASEAHKLWMESAEDCGSLRGIEAREEKLFGLDVSSVEIFTSEAAEALGKPMGRYYTLTLPHRFERGAEQFSDCVHAAAELIERCIDNKPESVLAAALGNPDITPDALGNLTAANILVTRHLKKNSDFDFSAFASLSLCRAGVLGTSGIESAAHIKALCELTRPELVIVIDALAGAEAAGLCRTVQFTNAGIAPGSGVGNDRQALNRDFLGVPTVAIGMPTVTDAGQFSKDMRGMFVTPKDIDSVVRSAGRLIGYAVNLAVHDVSIEDVDILIG